MDTLTLSARIPGGALSDSQARSAAEALRTRLDARPGSDLHTWSLARGVFSAEATIATGLTEGQFRTFVAALLPAGVEGQAGVFAPNGEELYHAVIPEQVGADIEGRTNPSPTPAPTTWTEPKA